METLQNYGAFSCEEKGVHGAGVGGIDPGLWTVTRNYSVSYRSRGLVGTVSAIKIRRDKVSNSPRSKIFPLTAMNYISLLSVG